MIDVQLLQPALTFNLLYVNIYRNSKRLDKLLYILRQNKFEKSIDFAFAFFKAYECPECQRSVMGWK